eukprot:TRINITY_DN29214_c0_g1_i1.p1 TRINITY_DN29214_c0_g1~~TRINITY_DN29214_c0_g1_i1.p1  ORF type:complete len:252 (-),score=50.21 TRINITY_DN29214_c0_g1_i1:255-1010(-)
MIRQPPRSTLSSSSAASDVYKRQVIMSSMQLAFYVIQIGTMGSSVVLFGLSSAPLYSKVMTASAVGTVLWGSGTIPSQTDGMIPSKALETPIGWVLAMTLAGLWALSIVLYLWHLWVQRSAASGRATDKSAEPTPPGDGGTDVATKEASVQDSPAEDNEGEQGAAEADGAALAEDSLGAGEQHDSVAEDGSRRVAAERAVSPPPGQRGSAWRDRVASNQQQHYAESQTPWKSPPRERPTSTAAGEATQDEL